MGGFAFLFYFFFSARFREILRKIFLLTPNFPSLGWCWQKIFVNLGARQRREGCLKFSAKMFFFCNNILKFGNLAATFKHVDAFLFANHRSNGPSNCLTRSPRLFRTMTKIFAGQKNLWCRKTGEIKWETLSYQYHCFQGASGTFFLCALMLTKKFVKAIYSTKTTKVSTFDEMPKHFAFSGWFQASFFRCIRNFRVNSQGFFRRFFRAKEGYRYNCFKDLGARHREPWGNIVYFG